jgi:ATP-binding cassette subfamily B protein
MKILLHYLSRYKGLVLVSFVLAALNTGFSLCDPILFGKLIDYVKGVFETTAVKENIQGLEKVVRYNFSESEFIKHLLLIIGGMVGVAMMSRIAKAFQDYTVNTVIQRFGADVYTDGLKRALQLPYQRFEDQRSGETLAVLEKVRIDSEKFISLFINVLFGVIVSVVFVMIYSISTYPKLVLIYIIGAILLSLLMSVLSKKIKMIQRTIVKETTALAGATTESLRNIELIRSLGLTSQEIRRLNITTQKILKLELKKSKKYSCT